MRSMSPCPVDRRAALRRPFWLGGLFAVTLLAASPASAANKGTLRATDMNGYGRLLLSFEQGVRANVTVNGNVLILSFSEPVNVDPDKSATELPAYIGVARRDPDGKALRFALAQPLQPSLKEAGEKLFLDLLPNSWRGQPPGLPQEVVDELARRARVAEEALRRLERKKAGEEVHTMPVRVAHSPTFTRIVFEMPFSAPVDFAQGKGRAALTFDARLRVDAARLRADLGLAAKEVASEELPGGLKVSLAFPENVTMQGFREDDTFIIDVTPPPAARAAGPRPRDVTREPKAPPPAASPGRAEAPPIVPAPAPAAPQATASQANALQAAPAAVIPASVAAAPAPAPVSPRPAASAAATAASNEPVRPQVTRDGETWKIGFGFTGSTPAAAFERAGMVTLVFQTQQPLDIAPSGAALKELGAKIESYGLNQARMVRIALPGPRLVRLAPDGDGWILTIGDDVIAASEPIAPGRIVDMRGRSVMALPLKGVAGIHWIDDPETGERIAVATARAPLRAVARPFRYTEFELPATAQGVAVVAAADDLTVRAEIDQVVIERGDGLSLTAGLDQAGTDGLAKPRGIVFAQEAWRDERSGIARERIRMFERRAADAPRGRKAEARLGLARTYFATGLNQEAYGVLNAMAAEDPGLMRDRAFALLRIAVAVRMDRLDEARAMLADEAFREDQEAALWSGLVEAKAGNPARALALFAAGRRVLDTYPDEWQAMIRFVAVQAAVETRDFGAAASGLDMLEKLDREWVPGDHVVLLRARIDEGQGRLEEAMAGYGRVYGSEDRQWAAEAGLRSAKLALADRARPREEAIERLETVAVTWRGNHIEAEALATLGRLYAEEGRWRDAFGAARRGNQFYPNDETVRALNEETARLFESLFLEGKADSLDRVASLALFYDFKEYIPPGRKGDEIVRRLADRLVDLDLLDSAAELLQHQIDNRISGAQRSIVAAKLAIVYLMNRKPAAANSVLRATRMPELPLAMKRARSLIEARALSDLSRTDLALDVVAQETGADAERLRADIFWQGRRWRGAGETYERLVGEAWKGQAPLDGRQRTDIVRAAIAYNLAEEKLSLDRVRAKFGPKMANSTDARLFSLVTAPSAVERADFREVATTVARSDTLAEFIGEYRKSYPDISPGTVKAGPAFEPQPAESSEAPKAPERQAFNSPRG